jgi:quercetin dioxygenase-like cupin family protein
MAAMATVSSWSPLELVAAAVSGDEREWVPAAMAGVWMRPLLFDTVRGAWTNVVRMRTQGFISRHAHPAPVHAYVVSGSWRYAERDWIAEAGSYVYEPPGDVHTLIAMKGESLTLFWITGTLIELDETGRPTAYADVFTRITQTENHFAAVGLGRDYVRKFIR